MRTALRIGLVVAVLLLGVLAWRACRIEPTPVPPATQAAEQARPPSEAAAIQRPEVTPASKSLPPAPARESAVLIDSKTEVARPAETVTLLRVHLLAKEDRAPLKEQRLSLEATDGSRGGCRDVGGQRGRIGECPTTDADGWAEFEVEPGRAYSVSCSPPDFDPFTEYEATALAQGEQREFEILVPTQDDVVLHGVLVDAESLKPVIDGTVQVEGKTSGSFGLVDPDKPDYQPERTKLEGSPIHVDAEGRFQLGGKSWKRRFVNATAPRYARAVFPLALGHSDSTDPLRVLMRRSATLEATIKDASGGPIMDATVDLSTDAYHLAIDSSMLDFYSGPDPHWSAKSDAIGKASVLDLPPNIPLKLVVKKKGMPTREEPESLTFKPGELRTIEIAYGSGGVVQGQVLDGSGRPVANQSIWRMVSGWPKSSPVIFESYEEPAATTKTDDVGRFRFEDVAVGTWCVGLAPTEYSRRATSVFPAYAEPVEVRAAGEVVDVVLRVDAGLFLRGKVIDPQGTPVPECLVNANSEDRFLFVSEQTDESGVFKLGPLPRGTWVVGADVFRGGLAPSLPISVAAGTNDLVLQLRTGASIGGNVLNSTTLEPAECEMTLASTDPESLWVRASSRDGKFKFEGLLPSTYRVCARDRTGFIGFSRMIGLAEGQAMESVEIRITRGAKLRLSYEGESKHGQYSIFLDGAPIHLDALEKGKITDETVPAGAIEVRWHDWDTKLTKTQSITLAVGEVREIVWDGKP